MIIISLHCQMGNQLFQYAFARIAAKKLNTLFIPFVSNPFYPFKLGYFELDPFTRFIYTHPRVEKQFKRICRKVKEYIYKETISDENKEEQITIRNNAYYEGFFQSDDYFKEYEPFIRNLFTIREKYRAKFEIKYGEFVRNNHIVVVHLRRTDYTGVEFKGLGGPDVALPLTYYHKALSMIPDIEQYKLVFIGDEMESIQKDFEKKPNYYFEKNAPIIDFQLLQHADIAIIANSSFAWWAAYLSQKKHSRIIAPEYWLGFKVQKTYPVGIRTDKFEWIIF